MEGEDENEYENTCRHGYFVYDCPTCGDPAELGESEDNVDAYMETGELEDVDSMGSVSADENITADEMVKEANREASTCVHGYDTTDCPYCEGVGDGAEGVAEGTEEATGLGVGEEVGEVEKVDYGACVYCGGKANCLHLVCCCPFCNTTPLCEHWILRSDCSQHKCRRRCTHNKDSLTCVDCNDVVACEHGDSLTPRCRACTFALPCKEHGVVLQECALCRPLESRKWMRHLLLRREGKVTSPPLVPSAEQPAASEDSASRDDTEQADNSYDTMLPPPHPLSELPNEPIRYHCSECGGEGVCLHGYQWPLCSFCNQGLTCKHDALRQYCRMFMKPRAPTDQKPTTRKKKVRCRGGLCPHDRYRYYCWECGGKGVCPHRRRWAKCFDCGTAVLCEHNRFKDKCRVCIDNKGCKHGSESGVTCGQCMAAQQEKRRNEPHDYLKRECVHGFVRLECPECKQKRTEQKRAARRAKRQKLLANPLLLLQTGVRRTRRCKHNVGNENGGLCGECRVEFLEKKRIYNRIYWQMECMHGAVRINCAECRKNRNDAQRAYKLAKQQGTGQPHTDDSQMEDGGVGSAPRTRKMAVRVQKSRRTSQPPQSCTHGVEKGGSCDECKPRRKFRTVCKHNVGKEDGGLCEECQEALARKRVSSREWWHKECKHGAVRLKCPECYKKRKDAERASKLAKRQGTGQPHTDDSQMDDGSVGSAPPPLAPPPNNQQTALGMGMGAAGNLPVHVRGNAGSGFVPPPSASLSHRQQMTWGVGTAAAGNIPLHVQVPPSPGPPDQMDFGGDESDGVEDHASPPVTNRKRKAKAPLSEQPPRVRQKRKSKATTNRPSLDQPAVTQPNTGDETSPPDTPIPPPSDAPATSKSSGRKRAPNARRPEHVTITGVWKNKLICEHGGDWRKCRICSPEEYCAHNRVYYRCPKCRILRMCDVHQKSRRLCKCPVPPGTVEADARKDVHRALPDTMADGNPQGDLHPGASGQYCIICRPYLGCVHQMLRNACAICASEINTWRREKQRGERQCAHGNAELACVTCHPELAATCFHGMETRDCGVCMEEREAAAGRNPGDGNVGEEEREDGEAESGPKKHHRVPPAQVPCEHGWVFACPLCFPALICQHESAFSECDICMTSLKKHAKWWGERTPAPKRICPHGKGEQYCTECRPHLGCRHGVLHSNCNRCRKEFDRWAEQKKREERRCMHGSLEVSCETCELELSEVCPHDVATRDCVACLGEREKELDSINLRCRHRKPPGECVVCMEGGDTEIDSEEEGKAGKKRLCKHGCIRACPLCFPQLVCKHNITFSTCTVCMTSLNRSRHWRSQGDFSQENRERPHRRLGQTCTTHGVPKNRCLPCKPHMGCRHGRFLTQCKPCRKEVRGWWEQRWREERICMHRRLEVSCETCKLELSAVCPHDVATRDCVGCLGEREKELESINATCYHGVPVSRCAFCLEQRQKRQRNTEGEERGGEETQTEEEGVEGAEEGESEGETGGRE